MPIHYELDDGHIVRITIDRPEARNAMDMEHFAQLRMAWDRFGEDDDAWVAVITGVGPDFCVGADLKTYIPQITALAGKMKDGVTEIDGYRLEIYFRMLQPRELARSMGFPKNYTFRGKKTEVVKQIGNAVSVPVAQALAKSLLQGRRAP